MTEDDLRRRTKAFATRIVRLCKHLPETQAGRLIGGQLFRAATSVGANYRAACRARSKAEFLAKLGIVLEEADESLYWLELLVETGTMTVRALRPLMGEADQLVAIFVASVTTARRNR
jgi:four helix bundle protein